MKKPDRKPKNSAENSTMDEVLKDNRIEKVPSDFKRNFSTLLWLTIQI